MDFVLRDAYMSGYNTRAFDLDRLLHYSFFTPQGLTIHARGMSALVRFMSVRAELFRTIYFHRTVRAIDLTLADLFADSKRLPVSRQPAGASRRVPAVHRVVAAGRRGPLAATSDDQRKRELGERWQAFLHRADSLEDGLRAEPGLRRRPTPSGAAFSAGAEFVEQRAARPACRRHWPTCRCGSTWPGTSIGPTRGGRATGRISSATRPAANLGR